MLTSQYGPTVRGRQPYWRPTAPRIWKEVWLPAWTWERPYQSDAVRPEDRVTLDVNGAYLAALSSGVYAHSALAHQPGRSVKTPGYYLMDAHPWQNGEIVSPLGTAHLPGPRVWVAHPTATLLTELCEAGYWPDATVYDAYTADTTMRFRKWVEAMRDDRLSALRARAEGEPGAAERYQAIKDGYSIAVQLMKGPAEGKPTKSDVFRPDWYATVHAQHAASTWRKAWASVLAGHGPIRMGAVDTITWTVEDLAEIQMRAKPLFRIDSSGEQIGALGVRRPDEGES